MPGGSLDPNGIWLYGEDDERDTFSELLNIGQDSVSDAVGSDRARITAIENGGALSGVSGSGIVTAGSGWSVGPTVAARRKAGVVWLGIDFTRTGSPITVPADGNIADDVLGTFNAGWQPASGVGYPIALQTRLGAGYASATQLTLTHLGPGSLMATGTVIRVMCSYPLG